MNPLLSFVFDWLSPQGIIAIGVIYAAIQAWRAKRASFANALSLKDVKSDVQKIELATNSMKDALVAATAKASHLEGERAGREGELARVEEKRQQMRTEAGDKKEKT